MKPYMLQNINLTKEQYVLLVQPILMSSQWDVVKLIEQQIWEKELQQEQLFLRIKSMLE